MKKLYLSFALLLTIFSNTFGQLAVTQGVVPATLVNTILGAGVQVSNITYTGAVAARGTFTCGGGCNVGFTSGILLTSGSASIAGAVNTGTGQGQDNGLGTTDPLLNTLTTGQTQDVCVLEFDFSVASDSVAFRYIFASDEYSDYALTACNDVFGFFISGPGIVGQKDIALIPGTSTPITINNLNNGNSPAGIAPTGPCNSCAYFRDNTFNTYTTAYDGLTTALVAGSRVEPCETYHIKLSIADVCDGIFDSGVFLEANSFASVGQIQLFANGVAQPNSSTVYACTGTSVTLSVNPGPTYAWNSGATTQSIVVNEANILPNGDYSCTVFDPLNLSCFAYTTTVHVEFVIPTASITPLGPTTICAGGNVSLQANVGTSYLWSTGETTQTINVSTAGNYTVTVTTNGCSAVSAPVQVTVGNAAATISGNTTICASGNTTLTANAGQTYQWSNGATTQGITVGVANTYTVTVTQAGGCTASASAVVTVNASPVPVITGLTSICQGASTTLNAGNYSGYLWTGGATTQTFSTGTTGTYTVTVTDANGCSGTTSATVTVNPLPVPVITGPTSFCQGGSTILNAGGGYSTYAWSTGASTQTIPVNTAGNFTVTVTNGFTCSANASVNVVVNANPAPVITGPTAFCQGASTTLNAGNGYSTYQWSTGATTQTILISSAINITVTVTNASGCTGSASKTTVVNPLPVPVIAGNASICQGANTTLDAGAGFNSYLWSTGSGSQTISTGTAGTYTVTVTNASGCSNSATKNVVVNPLPAPVIAGTLAFCQGGSSILNAGGGFSSYLWSTGANTQTISVSSTGGYAVTVTNGFNCSASTNVNVTVNALPVPVITGPLSFCQGASTTLNGGNGYSAYQWSTGATTQTIVVSSATNVTVTVTNANGCTGAANATTVVNPLPVPNATGVTSICQGTSTTFDAGAGYNSYLWSTGSGAQTINATLAGTYTVTVTDANGCSGSDNISLTVNPAPTPVIAGNASFCQGNSSVLDAGAGYSSYLWSTGANTRTISVSTGGMYSVTVTSANACSGMASQLITVHPLPNPAITGGTGICQGSSATLNGGNGYANYLWSTGASTQTISVSSAGNYAVTVTDNNGCSASANTVMVINPLPTPVIAGNTSICQNASTTFDAGAGYNSYVWSTGSGAQTINATIAGSYTVTVTDANGCSGSDNINLVVNPLPSPAITGNTEFCQGNSSVLNAGGGFNSYLWSTGAATQTISVNSSGGYSVTVTNNFGCSANTNVAVVVHQLPNPVITGGSGICTGSSTTLNAGNNYSAYVWSTSATTQTIVVTNGGNYAVTVTDVNGCSNSASTTMVVNSLPTPVITGITSICQNASTIFDAGFGYNSYQWSTGGGAQTINAALPGTYTVTVTDANGCSGSDNINLNVNALPTPAISGNTVFCQGDNTTLTANAGYSQYNWSNGSSLQSINTGIAGNYSVTVQDGNGCTASVTTTVVVNQLPTPVITGANAICSGTTSTLNGGNGYVDYMWSNAANTQTINVGAQGGYTVTVTDNNGCANSSAPFSLTVYSLPDAAISQSSVICAGGSAGFNISFNGTPPFKYTYNDGSQNIGPLTTSLYSVTVTVSPNSTATYTPVSMSDAHCNGSFTGSATVTVNALPTPVITGNNVICDGTSTIFNAGSGYTNYQWSTGETSPSITVASAGSYMVTVTDGNGCVNSTSQNLIVNQTPVISFTNDTSLTCQEAIIHFIETSTYPAGSTFQWDFGDGTQSSEQNPSHTFTTPGTYPINLTITTAQNCTASLIQNTDINFYPLPVAEFKSNPLVTSVFNSSVNFVDLSQNAVAWTWTFGDGTQSAERSPNHYFDDIGKFPVTLVVTNIAGCVSKYEQEVLITPFYVPNAFTPNGDGLNDVFFSAGYVMDVASYNMTIWNRWGQKIYQTDKMTNPWKGFDKNGNALPQGTYVYQIEVLTHGNKKFNYEGNVNLIR
jgi:gliding motility-associated-like protein